LNLTWPMYTIWCSLINGRIWLRPYVRNQKKRHMDKNTNTQKAFVRCIKRDRWHNSSKTCRKKLLQYVQLMRNAMQCNVSAMQCNTMQYNAMQCNVCFEVRPSVRNGFSGRFIFLFFSSVHVKKKIQKWQILLARFRTRTLAK
jgi:hypothetical protein